MIFGAVLMFEYGSVIEIKTLILSGASCCAIFVSSLYLVVFKAIFFLMLESFKFYVVMQKNELDC